jgi:poly-beta-hydroxybutyrate-responsive repressor
MPDRRMNTAANSREPSPGIGAPQTPGSDPTDPAAVPEGDPPPAGGPEGTLPALEPEERELWPGWPPRDILAPFVLLAVSLQRSHGYVIEDYLRALGLFGITMSTLYRTLRQMERDGFLVSTWEPGPTGPARRVYTITSAGQVVLGTSAAMLDAYRTTIDRFFGLYQAGPGASRQPAAAPSDEPAPAPDPDKETAP